MPTPSKGFVPTYHLPPNFCIPPDGPIKLGSIVNNLRDVKVLNSSCRLPIEESQIHHHRQNGFTSSRSRMRKGEVGAWARVLGIEGLGGELSWSSEKTEEIEYSFDQLVTSTFSPPLTYMRKSMKEFDVAEFVEATDWAPVYMVTGIKAAHKPAVRRSHGTGFAARGEVGLSQPGGIPVELGPRLGREGKDEVTEGWESSDDFIYGLRVEKLVYKRKWLGRRDEGPLRSEAFVKGAELVGEDSDDEDSDEDEIGLVPLGEETQGSKQIVDKCDGEDNWTVPEKYA